MKKKLLVAIITGITALLATESTLAQANPAGFFRGTWKVEGQEIYEHWDVLHETALKGVSYRVRNGETRVSEYLDITQNEDGLVYTATVPEQNDGKPVDFALGESNDSTFIFRNPDHDFPVEIAYHKLGENEIFVMVSGEEEKGFTYKLIRQSTEADVTPPEPGYDADKAEELGADDYGMKTYVLVLLKTGSNDSAEQDLVSRCMRGHLDNIRRLAEEKIMIVAGPMGRNDHNLRGIFILDMTSVEDARELLQSDPAIKEGLLEPELYSWHGSAALPEYLETAKRIVKLKP